MSNDKNKTNNIDNMSTPDWKNIRDIWNDIENTLRKEGFTEVQNLHDMINHIGVMINPTGKINDNDGEYPDFNEIENQTKKDLYPNNFIESQFPNLNNLFNNCNYENNQINDEDEDEDDEDTTYHTYSGRIEDRIRVLARTINKSIKHNRKKVIRKITNNIDELLRKKLTAHFAIFDSGIDEKIINMEEKLIGTLNSHTNYTEHAMIENMNSIRSEINQYRKEVINMSEKYTQIIELLTNIARDEGSATSETKTPKSSTKESKTTRKPKSK